MVSSWIRPYLVWVCAVPVFLASCAGQSQLGAGLPQASDAAAGGASPLGHKVGLGKVLSTKDGGQIFGFDIDQNGDDGVLASAKIYGSKALVSVETFNQNSGKITRSFAVHQGARTDYNIDGIFAGDVALVTHEISRKGSLGAIRRYDVMNPVTAEKFTGAWTPPVRDTDIQEVAENQSTPTAVLFGVELEKQDKPDLIVSNIAANTSTVFHLDATLFNGANEPQIGEYTAADEAVFALSPNGGQGGQGSNGTPLNVLINLKTGKETRFSGINGGLYGAGLVNGLAVDPNTGIAATTTQVNAQVEFYDLTKQSGIAVQLPCTGPQSEENSGSGIANDPVHHLFLVTDYLYCRGSRGSAIIVYDESGKLIETITGFPFGLDEPAPAINPSKRMGWAFGGYGFTQLRQFFY
ncbi:MAG: hypothetical protein WAK11_02435 [Candidatus Cybelea sp.]